MKKIIIKSTAVLLCVLLSCSFFTLFSFAEDIRTQCGGECGMYPAIIVPGLGQSSVCVTDENGSFILDNDGNKISAFPAYFETGKIVAKALVPVLASLITQSDAGLSKAASDIIEMSFGINGTDNNAQPSGNVITEKFLYSYAECSDYEKAIINSHIPFDMYPTDLPDDHIYYFSYNSFGNHIDITNELYDYIHMVMEQTGHDKVTLVPLSQGATIASALIEYYPDIQASLHKVIFVVPALDGSNIVGDILTDRITFFDKDYLYNGFLGEMTLMDKQTARLIEILLRILPDEVIMSVVNSAVDTLVEKILSRSTSMWALCPSGDYEEAAEKYLSSPETKKIREQTDKYYQAQLNSRSNIQNLVKNGVQVFCFAEYNMNLINVGERWNALNADFIIHLDSTSMGAYSAKVGEALPDGYAQQNTYCRNPEHNHISPDRIVDASAGLLPDTTFYFKNQRHDLTQHNNLILSLAMELIANDEIKDVYSSPLYPQFSNGRDVRPFNLLKKQAEEFIDANTLSDNDEAKLKAAVDEAEKVLYDCTKTSKDIEAANKNITDTMVELKLTEKTTEANSTDVFEKISLWLFDKFGTNGFSEMPKTAADSIIDMLK